MQSQPLPVAAVSPILPDKKTVKIKNVAAQCSFITHKIPQSITILQCDKYLDNSR